MRTATAASLIMLAAWISPGLAVAQTAPPGGSEADQYFETIPEEGGGGVGIDRGGGAEEVATGEPGGDQLSAPELESLASRGRDGQAAAEVAAGTAPESESGAAGVGESADGSGGQGGASEAASSSLPDTAGASPGDDGLGIALPLILAAAALGSLGFAIARRRASSTPV